MASFVRLCCCFHSTYSGLLCGIGAVLFAAVVAFILCTAVAVWMCIYRMQSGCCGICPHSVYKACCVVLLLSYVQQLLCGIALILFTGLLCGVASILHSAVAVWLGPFPAYSACSVVLSLSYAQRLVCGNAPIRSWLFLSRHCPGSGSHPPRSGTGDLV